MKRLFFLLFLIATSVNICMSTQPANAVTGADWQAGNIIDDGIFYDNSNMSVGDIQAFLQSQVPTCDTNGTQTNIYNPSQTNAQYAASQGWPGPPYICLKDYYQVPRSDQNINNLNTNVIPAGAISAAQIIKNAADNYGVNPKALIVTLQKESPGPLVTDNWPLASQYRNAMGYGCPDTAPCDPTYEGFYNQMTNAAWQFKQYRNNPASFRYKPSQVNSIQFNPNSGCGASDIFVKNSATAGLYNYTPYQPNQAALNNLYGTGDACSAYGNRNFWRIYNDWFGSTYAAAYAWQLTSQYAYTDSLKTSPTGLGSLQPGQRVFIGLTAKNTGNTTWKNTGPNPLRLGTTRQTDRKSSFYDPSWISPSRPALMKEAEVTPGSTATFEFWITAPTSSTTNFNEYFNLLAEASTWLPDVGMYFAINVQPARYTWALTGQYAFNDSAKTQGTGLYNIEPGDRKYVGMTIKNTGNTTWKNTGPNPLRLGTTRQTDRKSSFYDPSWISPSRPALMKEAEVTPGSTATFEFWITAPSNLTGNFTEYFTPLLEARIWLDDIGLNYGGSIVSPKYNWALMSQYAFTDASKNSPMGLDNLSPGQKAFIGFTAKNTGNITWRNDTYPASVGTINPSDRASIFYTPGWPGYSRPARMLEAAVKPGQIGTFEFWITAPASKGKYLEYFNLLSEGRAWMENIGFNFSINVR